MSKTCNLKRGKIVGLVLFPKASRYMIKKYGWKKATNMAFEKYTKIKLS